MSNNDGASRNYFQIPEGFRPPNQVRVNGYLRLETPTEFWYPTLITIGNNGIVNVGYGSGVTISQVAFAGSYYV